jgi:hypothetical protein
VLREELIEAKASASIEELYEKSNFIARKIIDSGPLEASFIPSFQDVLEKLRKNSE